MFGFDVILAYIRKQIGQRTDPANASGSLHAKVAELKNYVNEQLALVQHPRGSAKGSFATHSASMVTALNLSGKGRLLALKLNANTNTAAVATVKITVDGEVIAQAWSAAATLANQYLIADWMWGTTTIFAAAAAGSVVPKNAEISFNESLKLELQSDGNVYWTISWFYEIE
jgi:hypothetical protein